MKRLYALLCVIGVLLGLCSCKNNDINYSSMSSDMITQQKEEPKCKAQITNFSISQNNNFITNAVAYDIDEQKNSITLNVTYDNYADIQTLKNSVVDITVENGEANFGEALNADGSIDLTKLQQIVVTDFNGLTKNYNVRTERTFYNLPIVNVCLENKADPKKIDRNEYTAMKVYIDNSGNAEYAHDTAVLSGKIRGRGNSTWKWEKKPYKIKFDEKVNLFGLGEDKEWTLLANYADKSMIRNTVAYSISRSLDGFDWNPTQYPVDLFINGVYQGVYSLGEHMKAGENRVNVETGSTDTDTGFLIEVGGMEEGEVLDKDYFHSQSQLASFISFKTPESEERTPEQFQFIKDYVNKAETTIVAGEGYEEYIDVKSFCDWIIIHELTYNLDSCFRRSCYMTKQKGGKLKMGPVWDFDLAFGNYSKDNQNYDNWATIGNNAEESYVKENWCNYLMNDPEFRAALRDRWFAVKDGLLNEAMSCVDHYGQLIEPSQTKNYEVWKNWGKRSGYQSLKNLKYDIEYKDQLQYIKDFLTKRAAWIDNNI